MSHDNIKYFDVTGATCVHVFCRMAKLPGSTTGGCVSRKRA